ncbi:nucleoside triphosphate pyrophosphohydrolase family protein [Streptomyces sp. ID05-04B]|uniref:nucleoside triphosphate pyrophosphohydrolase family protein n=1 Tax=Streptomyces sp. ID05-04B TaxID=3028661 RepID=UPI0029C32F41|nr:nucleoside triphosphate pyrophosphohydrolase family protein [Streptomyces sp. ID05-04B]MDX5562838.1 nucleoside triphosphate pyrophosphohydrolase family protein [Streptomyces sp. ID05-04B]
MDFNTYQQAALKTVQASLETEEATMVAILGLTGETGGVATAYKKQLRDGPAHQASKALIREELGDVLWYLAVLADRFGLDLDNIAAANLTKVADRWRPTPAGEFVDFDGDFAPDEQLPRTGTITFRLETDAAGRQVSRTSFDGAPFGDPLTDASFIDDWYRFHDVFHLAYAAVLGWSPVVRSLMKRKRRSNPAIDEAEDGGRAIAIEEGISAMVFAYASDHSNLEGIRTLDQGLLTTVTGMVGLLEVSVRRAADWQKAIITGFDVWRRLVADGGGTVEFDRDQQSLTVR